MKSPKGYPFGLFIHENSYALIPIPGKPGHLLSYQLKSYHNILSQCFSKGIFIMIFEGLDNNRMLFNKQLLIRVGIMAKV